MSESRPQLFADPLASFIALVCLGIFALALAFVLGLVVLPIAAVAAGGYYAFRHFQTQKLHVRLPAPQRIAHSSTAVLPVAAPTPRYDPDKFAKGFHEKVLAYVEKDTGRISCKALSNAFTYVVTQLYADESFHEPPPPPEAQDLISRAAYQDKFEAWEKKTADSTAYELFMQVVADAYMELREHFPTSAFQEASQSSFTVPISIAMNPDQVESLAAWFFLREALDNRLFENLRERILANSSAIESARGKPTFDTLFAGTPIAAFSGIDVPFAIPVSRFLEHAVVVAGSGHGKTQTLGALIGSFLEENDPPAMVVVDSTGALVKRIQKLAIFNERLNDRIVIIDPEHDPVPALNMFDVSNPRMQAYSQSMRDAVETEVVALFNYVFTSAQNDLTSRQGTVFSYVVRLVLSIPGATIDTLRQVLEEDPKGGFANSKYKPHIERLDRTAQDFFRNQYFELKGFREQIAQRVYGLVQVPAFQRMFATRNKVDFFDELQNKGAIIVVNTSESLLKQDGSALFGRYIIARTMAAAFERASVPEHDRRPTLLVIDEAAPYFDDTFDKLLTRVRQFKLGVCVAFQHMEQAGEKLRSAIASNTSVKLAGGLGYTDSRWLARDMETTPEFLKAQNRDGSEPPQWTRLGCHVRNYTPHAVSIYVPFYTLENMPQMTRAEHAEMLRRNRLRVAVLPDDPPVPEEPIGAAPSPQPKGAEPVKPVTADIPPQPPAQPGDESAPHWE